jgi:anti-sigma factor RsiW
MNTTHPVAPEEIMAFLDGEFSAADAQAISAHLDHCAKCAGIAEQFRSTSQSLSRWSVPAIPAKLEDCVRELADKTRLGVKSNKPGLFVRASFWSRKQWILGLGSAVATMLLLGAVGIPNLLVWHSPVSHNIPVASARTNASGGSQVQLWSGPRGGDKLVRQPASDQQSKVFSNQIVAPTSTGADSNSRWLALGGKPQDSFAIDGQPGPMIAGAVSLSIVVKDFAAARSSLDAILARHHGYSAQLNVATPENAPRSIQASLRIPATALSSAVADLKALGRVETEWQSGEEVTQQHTDLVARLKNSRDTEQRFRTILQQRTGNIVEVLKVEEGIARVRGDIERMEAEQKALEHRVDFTAVELQLAEEYKAQLNPPAPSVSIRVHNSFVAGFHDPWDPAVLCGIRSRLNALARHPGAASHFRAAQIPEGARHGLSSVQVCPPEMALLHP